MLKEVLVMAEVPPCELVEERSWPSPRLLKNHGKGGLGNGQSPFSWTCRGGTSTITKTSSQAHQGGISTIAKTSLQTLSMVEKKWNGAPPSSRVPSFFWALIQARWSSSNQIIATSDKKQSLKFKEGKGTYLLACYNVWWRNFNLKVNKNHILYTLKP
jgi:hypothetical protein